MDSQKKATKQEQVRISATMGEEVWESRSVTRRHKLEGLHLWTIQDFVDAAESAKPDEELLSEEFRVVREGQLGQRETLPFRVAAFLGGQSGKDNEEFVALYLHSASADHHRLEVKFGFFVRRSDGSDWLPTPPYRNTFGPGPEGASSSNNWGFKRAFFKPQLLEEKETAMPDGHLTIGCSFEISCSVPQDGFSRCAIETAARDKVNGSLSSDWSELLREKKLVDAALSCRGRTFPCHRLVLSARSDVLAAMFLHDEAAADGKSTIVDISDTDPETLGKFLQFLYSDDCPGLEEDACGLLQLADKYNVPRLRARSEEALCRNLSPENAAGILVLSHLHESRHLKRVALHFIIGNMERVSATPGWERLVRQHPLVVQEVLAALAERPKEGKRESGSGGGGRMFFTAAAAPPMGASLARRRSTSESWMSALQDRSFIHRPL